MEAYSSYWNTDGNERYPTFVAIIFYGVVPLVLCAFNALGVKVCALPLRRLIPSWIDDY